MTARLLLGRPVADAIWGALEARTAEARARLGRAPRLGLVLGSDPAAQAYARSIGRAFDRHGLAAEQHAAPEAASSLRRLLERVSADPGVDGVLVLTPLPGGVSLVDVISAVDPAKDVDGQHPANLGRLLERRPGPVPATALGGLRLLEHYGVPLAGRRAVVVGRSPVVGLPLALLLLDANATVTVCHSRTSELAEEARRADVLGVAVGRPKLVDRRYVKEGAVVLDFGANADQAGDLVGDVDTDDVAQVAAAVTPARNGTGAVTTAVLAEQTVAAALAGGS
jgi:methylenetetrahydrofolate dehydrogenase (NADP+) / methenyltetrahydrofolate cyclohydrolase